MFRFKICCVHTSQLSLLYPATSACTMMPSTIFCTRLLTVGTNATTNSPAATITESTQRQQQQQHQQLARVNAAALKLNAYMNLHRSNVNVSKDRIVLQAWREIEELPEKYIEVADVDSILKMLQSFAYFRKYWDKGHDGPSHPLPARFGPDGKRIMTSSASGAGGAKARDLEEVEIPPEFYFSSSGSANRIKSSNSDPTLHQQGGDSGGGGGGGSAASARNNQQQQQQQNQRRFAPRPKQENTSASGGSADIVGQMIE